MEQIPIPTLEELLVKVEPKNVFIIVEAEQPVEAGDEDIIVGAEDLMGIAQRSKDITERVWATLKKVKTRTAVAYKTPVPEGHASIIPTYTFIGKQAALHDIGLSDVSFVYRLDGKIQIVRSNEEDVLPYTILAD